MSLRRAKNMRARVSQSHNLESMTKFELVALAKSKGLPGVLSRWRRETLIAKLQGE